MKDFAFVKFSNGTSDAILKGWMVGETKCYWPRGKTNVLALAKAKANFKENWMLNSCEILCDSRELKCLEMYVVHSRTVAPNWGVKYFLRGLDVL